MTRKTFLAHLYSCGFSRTDTSYQVPVYTHRREDLTIHVGLIPTHAKDSQVVSLDYYRDTDAQETEKEYETYAGAWRAIKRLLTQN